MIHRSYKLTIYSINQSFYLASQVINLLLKLRSVVSLEHLTKSNRFNNSAKYKDLQPMAKMTKKGSLALNVAAQ